MTEQDQEQKRGWLRRFWSDWWGLIVPGLIVLAVILFFGVLVAFGVLGTGFDAIKHGATPATVPPADFYYYEPEKTLWDWMELLLVPLALALGAAFFTWVTNKRERDIEDQRALAAQKAADQRAQIEREIASDRTCEAAYQGYLDRMTELIADGLPKSAPDDVKRSIGRARTLAVLRQLDGARKGLLLRFLYESNLVGEVDGKEADSRGAIVDLFGAYLGWAKLSTADLRGANLHEVDLRGADLHRAILHRADLEGAVLHKADLSGADLSGANSSVSWPKKYISSTISHSESMSPPGDYPESEEPVTGLMDEIIRSGHLLARLLEMPG
jgi:hypothetical protein